MIDALLIAGVLLVGALGIAALPWRARDLAATERAAWVVRDLALSAWRWVRS